MIVSRGCVCLLFGFKKGKLRLQVGEVVALGGIPQSRHAPPL